MKGSYPGHIDRLCYREGRNRREAIHPTTIEEEKKNDQKIRIRLADSNSIRTHLRRHLRSLVRERERDQGERLREGRPLQGGRVWILPVLEE